MPGNINIRMYNVGFGDCFLVTLPTSDGDRKILIDCGSIKKKKKLIEDIAKQVVEDVTVNGKARIDVLVLSPATKTTFLASPRSSGARSRSARCGCHGSSP